MKARGLFNYASSIVLLRYSTWHQNNLKAFFAQQKVDRLHVGCGNDGLLDGWCNVLYERNQPYGEIRRVKNALALNYNLLKPWPWPAGSVEYVAGAHFIEHLELADCLGFCKQALKVLKPGGYIRLSCPDLETYARNYIEKNEAFYKNEEIVRACVTKLAATPSQIFAAKAYDCAGAHKWFHDFSSLKSVLERSGFTNVRKVGRVEGHVPDLDKIELAQREIETVYVEAQKPI